MLMTVQQRTSLIKFLPHPNIILLPVFKEQVMDDIMVWKNWTGA